MPNISFTHSEYNKLLPKWKLINAFVEGADAVRLLGDEVLPRPNPLDVSRENQVRFDQYIARASFHPVVSRTLQGYNGQVFSESPLVKLPNEIAMMEKDIDGSGVSLIQQSSKALNYVISFGRCGLLVDFPPVEKVLTRADMANGNIRPTVTLISPFNIINWRTSKFGAVTKLSKLVIEEAIISEDDGFEETLEKSWRVLSLDKNGEVVVELWVEDKENKSFKPLLKDGNSVVYFPKNSEGNRLTEIPFTFIGSENNDESCDPPPLDGLTELNRAHFRNSADYEEGVFQAGQPTYYCTGVDSDWVKDSGPVYVGSRRIQMFPIGATFGLAQAKPNTLAFEAMNHKEKQMIAVGAKLIELSKVAMTATEVMLHDGASTSALARMANNVSQAYEWSEKKAFKFMSSRDLSEDEVIVRLSTDFRTNELNPSDQAQLVAAWQAGALTDNEMRKLFEKGSMTSDTQEEWQLWHNAKKAEEAAMDIKQKTVSAAKKE